MRSFLKEHSFISRSWQNLRSLALNKYFAAGLVVLVALMATVYLLADKVLMPSFVRYDVAITVPDVRELPIEEARQKLELLDFQVEVESNRYNPQIPRDIVVDQSPSASMSVKPGRRVYLTINTGATPEATVPSLEGISKTEAINRLNAAGLKAEPRDIRPDSIPHPYAGMITRQYPEAGKIVEEGSNVRLWYSTGLGKNYANVPSLVGMTVQEAKALLLTRRLRAVVLVLGEGTDLDTSDLTIIRQSHSEGTRIKEGAEIRLFVEAPDGEEGA